MNATDVTPVVGGVYKVYAPTFLGTMNGVNCWTVVSTQTTGLDDDATFGTNYGDCETCDATNTTTTTTTTSPTPQYAGQVDANGYGDYYDACTYANTTWFVWGSTANPLTATFYSDPSGTTLLVDTYPGLADGQYHYLFFDGSAYSVSFATDSTCGNVSYC
jgi:hypothetical protein